MGNTKENKPLFIECECSCEGLLVHVIPEDNFNYAEVCISMYSIGYHKPNLSFWSRVKNAFQYIKDGTFFADQIFLTNEKALELSRYIDQKITSQK